MSALVTVSNVWNSNRDRSVLVRPFIMAFVYVQTCVILIYILNICETRDFQSSLPQRVQLLVPQESVKTCR